MNAPFEPNPRNAITIGLLVILALIPLYAALTGNTFVMTLFLFGYHAWLFRTTVAAYILSLSEEMFLIYLLPQWQSNVRGSYWVVKDRLHVPTARWVPTAAAVVALAFIAVILAGNLFPH